MHDRSSGPDSSWRVQGENVIAHERDWFSGIGLKTSTASGGTVSDREWQ